MKVRACGRSAGSGIGVGTEPRGKEGRRGSKFISFPGSLALLDAPCALQGTMEKIEIFGEVEMKMSQHEL